MDENRSETQKGEKTITVRKMPRANIIIKQTGTMFVAGEVFKPTWDDLSVVVRKLVDLGIAEDLVQNSGLILKGANRVAINEMVPKLLEAAAYRNYADVAPFQVKAILWVLACYWHMYLGGPRPSMPRPTRKPRLHQPTLRCPYCFAKFPAPQKSENQGFMIRQFSKWLYRHAYEYHHESIENSIRHIETDAGVE